MGRSEHVLAQGRRPRRGSVALFSAIGAVMTLALGLGAGFVALGSPLAGAAPTTAPGVSSWAVSPQNLPYTGGTITFSASVTNATQCTFSAGAGAPVTGLPVTVDCSGGTATATATVSLNATTSQVTFPVYISMVGPEGYFSPGGRIVLVAPAPFPRVTSFAVSPQTFNYLGGSATASVAITDATTCSFRSSPPLPGLPTTVGCSGGTASVPLTFPANASSQAAYYSIYVTAQGYGPVRPTPPPVIVTVNSPPINGYWEVGSDGGVYSFGSANFYGSAGGIHLNKPIVGMASAPGGNGYWLVASDGGIFSYGSAVFYGSTGAIRLNEPIVGMAPTPDGRGYYLVASDGGVFCFGDAHFQGSMGGRPLNAPVVGIAVDPSTGGYWLVASDGGIFSFNAPFEGSAKLSGIVAMAATANGGGYWLVSTNGGVFSFGDAPFYGSLGSNTLTAPIVGMATSVASLGYYLVASDGAIYAFGKAVNQGSTANLSINAPIVGMATS